ncbi:Uncharacterised protein [uncultured archaeon]|nr:Uncharacterised protein [uncultured archaeon]
MIRITKEVDHPKILQIINPIEYIWKSIKRVISRSFI